MNQGNNENEQRAGAAAQSRLSSGWGSPFVTDERAESPQEQAAALLKADAEHRSLAADQVLMLKMVMPAYKVQADQLNEGYFRWNKHQGFWPAGWNPNLFEGQPLSYGLPEQVTIPRDEYIRLKKAEKIALMHSELSEMLEAVRNNDLAHEGEEAADVQIRLRDYCGGFGIPLAHNEEQKQFVNYRRPAKHGKKF